ncbi:MAG: hypothetical protein A3A33_02565 [Candidatus Yanofskybacteria bacterium RIFCSPLOWO2_01_FULL_49_25]|uniref:Isoleucine--tRNA ligase n=1 Tax=Candidatus Yanofskybacteria bacterium RIFCSPLOWO2_01_FULL_49_25 TaxID=1802701 RepID=A0A1F8GS17_9BACT|nr:MAG: hypothetical protein A3A33_02565 [Candidatus Yanofskybacteria bacterium RIFCSPLOWO2_01_FULL_49_25]
MADFDIQKLEEKILKFWDDRDIFARTLKEREGKKRFVFFDGPPTANGKPGIHHFIGRAFKDLWPRYKTMRGYYVARKAGWDTHGLPVEIEVEKELGLKNKKDIESYGIAKFNAKAKASVWKYKEEWQRFTKRIGFWLDLEHPYITYEPSYMETLWWIIAQIHKGGHLYEGHKVLPWCTRCGTALSSHEVAQGYQDVTEVSVYVKLKAKSEKLKAKNKKLQELIDGGNLYFTAWTTTPWTLPGNVALAVGEKINYIVAKSQEQNSELYIIAKERAEAVLSAGYEAVLEVTGKDLIWLAYEPLFDIKPLQTEKSHRVYPADFVTTTDGTGIVHTAVMYGEDDYELGKKLGLPMHHTVAENGTFTKDVPGFEGQYVKTAEKGIIEKLAADGLLLKAEPYTHSYPHCWRCKRPLLYYARNSWFVAMSKLRKQLLKNNNKINWYPEHLKEGRFGEFLKEVKDWAFSRERYWGTPLPVWKCTNCMAQRVIGSLAELEEHRYKKSNTFHLVRHGHSENNAPDGLTGTTNYRLETDTYHLTADGKKTIEELALKLKESGGVDAIYVSPFMRAKETAEILKKHLGCAVHVDPQLGETTFNIEYDNHPYEAGKGFDSFSVGNFDEHNGAGESLRQLRERMTGVVRALDKEHEGKRFVIVSHGHPLWMLTSFFENKSDQATFAEKNTLYTQQGDARTYTLPNYPYDEHGELDLHRPYIDEITLKCTDCGGEMRRVKEVVDVWFDSGAMPYAQWHYPFPPEEGSALGRENFEDSFKQSFPAEFITEAIDQTRGWFYTLLAISTLLGKGAPYKNVVSYSHVLDEKGKKMSKSIGNVVDPWKVIEQYGVDATRWYFYSVNDPGDPKLFAVADVGKRLHGFIMTLVNSLRFLELYDKPTGSHSKAKPNSQTPLDRWILSRLHDTIGITGVALDAYDPVTASRGIEQFVVDDLSNWWIRRSRDRFQHPVDEESLQETLNFFRYLLIEISKLCAPFIPFMAEHLYKQIANRKESVHLEDWPKAQKKYLDPALETHMKRVREISSLALAQRKIAGIKVRQPLATLTVKEGIAPELEEYLKDEINVKRIAVDPAQTEPIMLDTTITEELKLEGYAREIMRNIQDMRKEAGYKLDELVRVYWRTDSTEIQAALTAHEKEIMSDTSLQTLDMAKQKDIGFDVEHEFKIGSETLTLTLKK